MDSSQQESERTRGVRTPGSDRRILLWSVIAIVLLVSIAFAVTFIENPELDPDTPEGVVQRYLQAIIDGEEGAARAYLSDRLQGKCTNLYRYSYRSERSVRIEWLRTTVDGSTAYVDIRETEGWPDIFDHYNENERVFTLALTDEGWRITHQKWPWYECSEGHFEPGAG